MRTNREHIDLRKRLNDEQDKIIRCLNLLVSLAGKTSKANGFHETSKGMSADGLIASALIASEVGELVEEFRKREIDKTLVAEEMADIIIRCLDLAYVLNLQLPQGIVDKMRKNIDRPFRHGKSV